MSGDRFLQTNQSMSLFTQARQASFRLGVGGTLNQSEKTSETVDPMP